WHETFLLARNDGASYSIPSAAPTALLLRSLGQSGAWTEVWVQFANSRSRIEIGPVVQGKICDLPRVVGAVLDADLASTNIDGLQPATVLQDGDVCQRRTVEHGEIGEGPLLEGTDMPGSAHEAGIALGRRPQRLRRGEAEIGDKEFQL